MDPSSATPVWRALGTSPLPMAAAGEAPVVIVGGGPVGLTLALDLGRRGHKVVLISRLDFIAAGSKAICFSKRSLEIFDRLGVGDAIVDEGVTWDRGKVFWGDLPEPIYEFDLLPNKDQKRPAFINLQQYLVEERLIEALADLPNVDLRWGHRAEAVEIEDDGVRVRVGVGADTYLISARFLIACDGARSTVRTLLGLDFTGRAFEDNFLIADIRMAEDRPAERWFWFEPPFNGARSALLHKQPHNVWRLDFQLGASIDREACTRPENVEPFVRAMLGDVAFEREWYSVYTFQCRRMKRFVHGQVIFAGDSAHLVSPFGARGCNGGLADAANLGWKLDLVLRDEAGSGLLASYDHEATVAADDNIRNSMRSTDFMCPRTEASRALRDIVLELAAEHAFARPFVNSGRLSVAIDYPDSPLSTPDEDAWRGGVAPGSPAVDVNLDGRWLLDELRGEFSLLASGCPGLAPNGVSLIEAAGTRAGSALQRLYGLEPGSAYLLRPDSYVAARWKRARVDAVEAALQRARGE